MSHIVSAAAEVDACRLHAKMNQDSGALLEWSPVQLLLCDALVINLYSAPWRPLADRLTVSAHSDTTVRGSFIPSLRLLQFGGAIRFLWRGASGDAAATTNTWGSKFKRSGNHCVVGVEIKKRNSSGWSIFVPYTGLKVARI